MSDRKKRWQLLQRLLSGYARERFALTAVRCEIQGPCLIVANHVTNWDPLLLAASFPDTPIRFVASEHLFRHGLISKVIQWAVAPIPRRKAASGTDTVKSAERRADGNDRNTCEEEEKISPEYIKKVRQEPHCRVIGIES